MSFCGSNAGKEMSAPLISAVVSNALFHSKSRINQILPQQVVHILGFFWETRWPILWNKCIEVGGCSVDRNLEVHTSLLHYCTFGLGAANDAQNVSADTGCRNNDQQNILKIIIWYRTVYNQTASDAWRYNNPVYKLTTDKLQVATDVNWRTFRSIFEH